jgi:hypothetical protein
MLSKTVCPAWSPVPISISDLANPDTSSGAAPATGIEAAVTAAAYMAELPRAVEADGSDDQSSSSSSSSGKPPDWLSVGVNLDPAQWLSASRSVVSAPVTAPAGGSDSKATPAAAAAPAVSAVGSSSFNQTLLTGAIRADCETRCGLVWTHTHEYTDADRSTRA